jgi:hypothetical protein
MAPTDWSDSICAMSQDGLDVFGHSSPNGNPYNGYIYIYTCIYIYTYKYPTIPQYGYAVYNPTFLISMS